MTKLQHTITIARPVDEVWDYVLTTRNDPVWITNVVEVGRGADAPIEPGLEIEETFKFLGVRLPLTLTVTEHEPRRRSAIKVTGGPVPGTGSYEFEPVDGGTRFTMTMETEAHGFFKLAEPVFSRMARREVATSVEQLKDILETRGGS
jgi:uncharacterized membrane protein